MSSERRIQSSRANGARSHGPVTRAGRLKSAYNNLRHGILAETVVLEDENSETFNEILAALTREFDPQTEAQLGLVETMASARWRLMRIWSIERQTLKSEIGKHDPGKHDPAARAALAFHDLANNSRTLDVINRYESRYDRQYSRSLNLLLKLADEPYLPNNPVAEDETLTPEPLVPTESPAQTDAPQICQTNLIPQPDTPSRIGLPACPGDDVASLPPSQPAPPDPPTHAEPGPPSGIGLPACPGDEVASLPPSQPAPPDPPTHAEPGPPSGIGLPACPGDEVASLPPSQPAPPDPPTHAEPGPPSGIGLPACPGDEVASLPPSQPAPPDPPTHAEPGPPPQTQSHDFKQICDDLLTPLPRAG